MNPTEYFRFVERGRIDVRHVLQQWWESEKMVGKPEGEWRDVPLLEEDNRPPHEIEELS